MTWHAKFRASRDRTLLLLVPPACYARQEAFAHEQLDAISIFDWRAEFLRTVRPEQRYLNLSVQGEVRRLKEASGARAGQTICVINTEYALTRLDYDERQEFWRSLWSDFPYNDSILIYSALDVPALLPFNLQPWQTAGRVLPLSPA